MKEKKFSDLPERDELIAKALSLGAQPGWTPQKPVYTYGLPMTRYNKIEALSTGISARATLGKGYTASAFARSASETGSRTASSGCRARMDAARLASTRIDDCHRPATGLTRSRSVRHCRPFSSDAMKVFTIEQPAIELAGTPDDSATTTWRLFAENHTDAEKKTNFSVAKTLGADGFEENIEADHGNIVGAAAERHMSYGLNPRGFRFFGSVRGEAAAGSFKYGRGMVDATASRGLFKGVDAAVTLGTGSTVGDVPLQRFWYLGGSQTVRGQAAGTQFGDAFWMGDSAWNMRTSRSGRLYSTMLDGPAIVAISVIPAGQ